MRLSVAARLASYRSNYRRRPRLHQQGLTRRRLAPPDQHDQVPLQLRGGHAQDHHDLVSIAAATQTPVAAPPDANDTPDPATALIGPPFPFEDQRVIVPRADVSAQTVEVRSSNGLTFTASLDALWKAHQDYDCPWLGEYKRFLINIYNSNSRRGTYSLLSRLNVHNDGMHATVPQQYSLSDMCF